MKNINIFLALIHNGDHDRNSYIQPHLKKMITELNGDFSVKNIEVSFQSEIQPYSFFIASLRDLVYWILGRQWFKYRLYEPSWFLKDFLSFSKICYKKYILESDSTAVRWKRNSAIEVAVTDKHVRAWSSFLESDSEYLICFEDDAVFKADSIQKVKATIKFLEENNSHKAVYAYRSVVGKSR